MPEKLLAPGAPTGLAATVASKQLTLRWNAAGRALTYRVQKRLSDDGTWIDEGNPLSFTQVTVTREISVHLTNWLATRYRVQACNADGCTPSEDIGIANQMLNAIVYAKPSNHILGEYYFGNSIAVSADGKTIAVGAPYEQGASLGINGDQTIHAGLERPGAVYVFAQGSNGWAQQAYIKPSVTQSWFGWSVALSADGNTLAVNKFGGEAELEGGRIFVFSRTGSVWSEQAILHAHGSSQTDYFGRALAISGDGDTIAMGAPGFNFNSVLASGTVCVFARLRAAWSRQSCLEPNVPRRAGNLFGAAVALSHDGNLLAAGAGDEGNAEGGLVYIFSRVSGSWSQQHRVVPPTQSRSTFGNSLAISADAATLAVGAWDDGPSGSAHIFARVGAEWSHQAYLKGPSPDNGDRFGAAVALSGDGKTLAVGAFWEDGGSWGVGGIPTDNSWSASGAVFVFARVATSWILQTYVKATNTDTNDEFGRSVALSFDGSTLVVGARAEDSSSVGINGDQLDDSRWDRGAVYIY